MGMKILYFLIKTILMIKYKCYFINYKNNIYHLLLFTVFIYFFYPFQLLNKKMGKKFKCCYYK